MKVETLLPLGKLDPGLARPESPLDLRSVAPDAAQVDALGYHALLMEETKDDPFPVLSIAAAATERVRVGTSVAIAFARSPFVTAMSAWTLQKISNGRFELGLGSQVRGHIMRRFGMDWHAAGPWMRDYLIAVRAIWEAWQSETPFDFVSEHYTLNLNVPLFTPAPIEHPNIPIQVAAVNPFMCSVAADVADGVRLHPVCSAAYIKTCLNPLMIKPGRPNFEVCLKPLIAAARNEEVLAQRKEIARARLAFYVSTPAYRRAFSNAGLESLTLAMSELSKHQQWTKMATLIDDEVLEEWVIIATYDQLAAKVKERYAGLIDRIELSIPVENEQDAATLADIVKAISNVAPVTREHST